ncbi:unnamed protein product [Sphagnum troendelagicum]
MASLGKIIRDDRHPIWLVDSIILSAVVYASKPEEELKLMEKDYGLPASAKYEFVAEEELQENGFGNCKQSLLVVRSLTDGHFVVACRGTTDISDALTDLNFIQRTMTLTPGAAHAGFLDRAKTIPLEYFRRLLVRGERVVLTGHSLGGAVASLLALRLLEATGRWCHAQIQCYTFGCPFFADYRLSRYINKRYKHHFVHIVSRNDIVPKVMPLAYTIYSMWAGLNVGPLAEVMQITRVVMLILQVFKVKTKKLPFVIAGTQALTWAPAILRFLLHRALALALSHQSGFGYAFAGHMVLLDTETNFLEYADMDHWKMEQHLSFHLNCGSIDAVREHSLLSYIDHVFAVESNKASCETKDVGLAALAATTEAGIEESVNSPRIEVCTATLSMKWFNKEHRPVKQLNTKLIQTVGKKGKVKQQPTILKKKKTPALKSRVACLIFARRMQEVHPKSYQLRARHAGFMERVAMGFHQVTKFVHKFDSLFLASTVICVGIQVKRFFFR